MNYKSKKIKRPVNILAGGGWSKLSNQEKAGVFTSGLDVLGNTTAAALDVNTAPYIQQIQNVKQSRFTGNDFNSILSEYNSMQPIDYITKDSLKHSAGEVASNIGLATAAGAGTGTVINPGIGTLIGGAAGLITGTTGEILQNINAGRQADILTQQAQIAQTNRDNNLISALNQANISRYRDIAAGLSYALGGKLLMSDEFNNGVKEINVGGTHENNPHEGVPMGVTPDGEQNLVEEGEVIYNDYVFSNRIKVPRGMREKYKLRGETFAEVFKNAQKESEERPNDPISKKGLGDIAMRLARLQESIKGKNTEQTTTNKQFKDGGPIDDEDKKQATSTDLTPLQEFLRKHDLFDSQVKDYYQYRFNYPEIMKSDQEIMRNRQDAENAHNNYLAAKEAYQQKMLQQQALDNAIMNNEDTSEHLRTAEIRGRKLLTDEEKTPLEPLSVNQLIDNVVSSYIPNTPITSPIMRGSADKDWATIHRKYPTKVTREKVKRERTPMDWSKVDNFLDSLNPFSNITLPRINFQDINLSRNGESDLGWLRYADPMANALAVGLDTAGLTNNPTVYNQINKPSMVSPQRLNDFLSYNPLDTNYLLNQQSAQAAATRNALMQGNSPNRGALLLANDLNNQIATGDIYRKAQEANNAELAKVAEFNRATRQANIQSDLAAQTNNIQNLMNYDKAMLEQAKMNTDETNATMGARAANISSLAESLAGIGQENDAKYARDQFIQFGPALADYMKPKDWSDSKWQDYKDKILSTHKEAVHAYGGKVKRKKKGLTY